MTDARGKPVEATASNQSIGRLIHNPVLRGFHPDPSMLRVGDDYYIATSTFEWFPGVRIHHSRDLVNWQLLTHVLTRRSQVDLLGDPPSCGVWAPDLSYHDQAFHLAYTNVRSRRGGFVDSHNYLVTAPDIQGPWSEPTCLNSSGFDPSLFHDDDGRCWLLNMIWDSRVATQSGGIVLQEYARDEGRLVGPRHLIFKGTALGGTEGPHLYRHGGHYHLMTAEGGTSYGHAVTMARARRITGPYELDPGNPILTSRDDPDLALQKSGHASLVETPDGSLFLAHLCGRPLPGTRLCTLGRETALQRCRWNADGWLRLDGEDNRPLQQVAAPNLPAHPFAQPAVRDDFDHPILGSQYNTLREPADESWLSLTERPGFLRLYGRESPASRFRQSLVARRLEAFRCQAATRVEFEPECFQQMAGLICRYDEENYWYLRLSRDERLGANLAVLSADGGKPSLSGLFPIDAERGCHLRVIFERREAQFGYSLDGQAWESIGDRLDAGLLSDEHTDGFTGTFVGLAAQDLSGRRQPADFDFFELRHLDD